VSLRCRLLAGWSSGSTPDIFAKVFFRGSMLREFELVEYRQYDQRVNYGGKCQCRKRARKGKMKPTKRSDLPFNAGPDAVSLRLGAPRDRVSVGSRSGWILNLEWGFGSEIGPGEGRGKSRNGNEVGRGDRLQTRSSRTVRKVAGIGNRQTACQLQDGRNAVGICCWCAQRRSACELQVRGHECSHHQIAFV
jgi:hypothetical protein